MEIIKNKDEMSTCNNCLDRNMYAETIIKVNGLVIRLCSLCRKELMIKLINKY